MMRKKGLVHMKHLFPHRVQVRYALKTNKLSYLGLNTVNLKPKKSQ